NLRKVASRLFRAFPHEAETPLDKMRICELQHDAVADLAGTAQCLGAVSGDPHRWYARIRPRHLYRMILINDLLPGSKIAHNLHRSFEVLQRRRLLAHHAARAVAAADAEIHAAAGNPVQCREQTGGHGWIAHHRIRYACSEAHALRVYRHQSQEWISL